jgi:hypothetical protein
LSLEAVGNTYLNTKYSRALKTFKVNKTHLSLRVINIPNELEINETMDSTSPHYTEK